LFFALHNLSYYTYTAKNKYLYEQDVSCATGTLVLPIVGLDIETISSGNSAVMLILVILSPQKNKTDNHGHFAMGLTISSHL
jgi:hypothetical protein